MTCRTFTFQTDAYDDLKIPMPQWAGTDESINNEIKLFDMWDDSEIETVYRGLRDEPLVLRGVFSGSETFVGTDCFPLCFPICFMNNTTDIVETLWAMQNNGEEITINDLSTCLNGVYVLEEFRFNTIKKSLKFSYVFKLQKVRDL